MNDHNWYSWIQELADRIINDIHFSDGEPLDGDETSRIGQLLSLELDYRCGNLTPEEYDQSLLVIERKGGI